MGVSLTQKVLLNCNLNSYLKNAESTAYTISYKAKVVTEMPKAGPLTTPTKIPIKLYEL